ncbi:hypothetical protein [Mycobacterium sp. M26]|uniref:hypothetical protein n=1 Tax=Mycobacterium sp. M26 TaxID=1762962 RepID=UPI00073F4506|nr:hypothetical protein [Mycobacterium sp. M26]
MRIRAGVCLLAAASAVASALAFSPAAGADPDCTLRQSVSHNCANTSCPSGAVVSSSGECGSQRLYPPAQAEPAPAPLIGVI